ncbi:MFS transporter, partial [Streptomyces sp. NPDC059631]
MYRRSAQEDSSRRPRTGALPGGRKARAVASTVTSRPGYGQLLRTRGAWTFLL